MVHDLIPYEMVSEEYQDGWIQAAVSRGVTEDVIRKLLALMTD